MTKPKADSKYPPRGRTTAEERFWLKVEKGDSCWLWTAGGNNSGYGTFNPIHYGTPVLAHRYSYELANGPIPAGQTIDHLCKVRRCVNSAHMEVVSGKVNILRSDGFAAVNAVKAACPKGHEYDIPNTYVDAKGQRHCRACRAARMKVWHSTH